MSPSSSLLTPAASCWARSHQGPSSSSFSGFSLDVASHGGLLCLPVSLSRTPLPFLHGLMTVCNRVCIDAMNFCLPHQTVSSRTGAESFSFIAVFVGTGAESGVKLPLRNVAARSGAMRPAADAGRAASRPRVLGKRLFLCCTVGATMVSVNRNKVCRREPDTERLL